MKDIFSPTRAELDRQPLARRFSFQNLVKFTQECQAVVVFINGHTIHRDFLASQPGTKTLKLPAATRWGSIEAMFESLLDAEGCLQSIVMARGFIVGNADERTVRIDVQATVSSQYFVGNLQKALSILKPIQKYIKMCQSDQFPVSDVFKAFMQIPKD